MNRQELTARAVRETKESASFPAVTGAASLLVIFSVLCLTVFALLSLSTVLASHRLGEKNAAAVSGYYEADAEANRILAALRAGEVPEGVRQVLLSGEFGDYFEYECRISETQVLQVVVTITPPGPEGAGGWSIQRWQVRSTLDWEPSPELPVWQQ